MFFSFMLVVIVFWCYGMQVSQALSVLAVEDVVRYVCHDFFSLFFFLSQESLLYIDMLAAADVCCMMYDVSMT